MPNIAKVLKDEITRVARREAKKVVGPVKKPTGGLRRTAAELKRRVAFLEKELRALRNMLHGLQGGQSAAAHEQVDTARITAKGMRSLRRRLRLTGQEFAKLLGITGQVVYGWEKATGPLRVRQSTRSAILSARRMGAREARRRLDQAKGAKKPGRPSPRRRARR